MNKNQCIIIGYPVKQSLSPLMHAAGYRALGIENTFSYQAEEVKPEDLENKIKEIRARNVRGVSVTIPHKEDVIPLIDDIDETAQKIGAVNTIYRNECKLIGTNTDWLGVLTPLAQKISIKAKKALLLGAGGAARAACYALKKSGAEVIIANRTIEKAKELAQIMDCGFIGLEGLKSFEGFSIIINSIPYKSDGGPLPINGEYFLPEQVYFDMVYLPHRTALIDIAEKKGAKTIPGIEMLLYQGIEQFKIFTGHKAPQAAMRQALLEAIK